MKIKIYITSLLMFVCLSAKSQTTAMDFNRNDCAGVPHHLFAELDSGYCVIMEFIMTCSSCISSGHAIETMISDIATQFPNRIKFYQIAYTNSYTCATMENFKNANGFSSATFDQGANMVAYYGGFGMPTVAIVGGMNHDVLYTMVGFAPSDTTQAGPAMRSFLTSTGIHESNKEIISSNIFPNPANDRLNIEMNLAASVFLKLEILDMNGRLISEICSEEVSSGMFKRQLDVASLSAGYYMLKTTINNKSDYSKIRIAH